jgi:hypothetical protein
LSASLLLAATALVSAFLIGGRYTTAAVSRGDGNGFVLIVEPFTGSATICAAICKPTRGERS